MTGHVYERWLEERRVEDVTVIGRQAAQLQAQAATITAVRNALADNKCADCGCLHAAIQDALDGAQ